jgi:hypothetical protein
MVQAIYLLQIISGGTSWQAVKTTGFTAVAGEGYFCDTSSAAFTATLPATPTLGDEVTFVDYAGTFDTNNLTVGPKLRKHSRFCCRLNCICRKSWFNFSIFRSYSRLVIKG